MTSSTSSKRIKRLEKTLEEPLLVTDLVNVFYLTGVESSNAALLVDPGSRPRLFTDARYSEAAREATSVKVEEVPRAIIGVLAGTLEGRVGFEADALPYAQYEVLAAGKLDLVPRRGLVEALRAVKEDDELGRIRHSALAAERAFEALTAETWIGHSEQELVWRLRQLLHAHGADRLSFESLVLSGTNGSKPHGEAGPTIIEEGTLVTVDWGAQIDGYCSDCTRTLATGKLPPELRRAYDVCLEAQLAAVEGIRPGMTGAEADALARDVIEAAGFGAKFGHGLGHGVGLAVHEAPRLTRESQDVLKPGMVLTIEPGIYLPGLGGVRIEDLAVVTADGVELFTSFPKDLINAH
jgi:Xaa-Pro aminopeptidase